jgi:AcrR family transcriptional regulator
MEKRSKKLISIVESAKALFWKHGIKRVSVDEICKHASVSRMTFYKFFPDKISVLEHIITEMTESGLKTYYEIQESPVPYEEKVRMMIAMKVRNTNGMSGELLTDIYRDKEDELFRVLEDTKNRIMKIYIEDLMKAQKNGDVRSDVKPEFLIYMVDRFAEMIADNNLKAMYQSNEQLIKELTGFFFYGILPEREKK